MDAVVVLASIIGGLAGGLGLRWLGQWVTRIGVVRDLRSENRHLTSETQRLRQERDLWRDRYRDLRDDLRDRSDGRSQDNVAPAGMRGAPPMWARVRETLTYRLGADELETICFDLGIDYDSLPGEGRGAKVRELLALLQRQGQFATLTDWLAEHRPDIDLSRDE